MSLARFLFFVVFINLSKPCIVLEQCRLDGAMCSFSEDDKMDFLQKAFVECEVANIEMESACLVAMCNRANVKCKYTVYITS